MLSSISTYLRKSEGKKLCFGGEGVDARLIAVRLTEVGLMDGLNWLRTGPILRLLLDD
jgi:hypothetical protein